MYKKSKSETTSKQRLGKNIIPINYKLFINTNFETFKFDGKEEITIRIRKPSNVIRLNSNEISFKSARLVTKNSTYDCKIKQDERSKTVDFILPKQISGQAKLLIDFIGTNNDNMYGFYRSSYKGRNAKKEYLLASQFEAADARAAFPCFDEPKFKATFDVTLEVPNNMSAISNMPIKSEQVAGNRKTVKFFTTPKMSSYLLFLGVGKFEKISTSTGKIKINAYATEGKSKLCRRALSYAKKFVLFYEKYFNVKYPLPKIDLLAIPDFAAGAMENWGAITFRETSMLGDEKNSSILSKQLIAETVAHELAHQWFGDLVTMEWWNDLWLNESFATFMSFKAMGSVFPEWQTNIQYFDEVISTAFSADAISNTHPISVNVSTPEQINEIFDEISYEKGGTFLHMLEDFASPSVFRKGLHNYLKSHAYSNATKYDLWNSIAKEAIKSKVKYANKLKMFADKWLENSGYPILMQDNKNPNKFTQQRFLISKPLTNDSDKQIWPILIKYINGNKVSSELTDKKAISLHANWEIPTKLNYKQDHLYRVKYSDNNIENIGNSLNKSNLTNLDIWGIENDLFSLARSGDILLEKYLNSISEYCMDATYPANSSILSHIEWLDFMLYGTSQSQELRAIGIKFAKNMLNKLGWSKAKNEKNIDSLMRSHAIRLLGQFNDKETVTKAKHDFDLYLKGKIKIEPDLKTPIYDTCASNGDPKLFDKFFAMYKKESNPEEKRRFLQTLGFFRGKREALEALKICISNDVRLQDSFVIPTILSSNPESYKYVKTWTLSNWQNLKEKYSVGTHMLSRFIENFSMLYSENDYAELKSFFNKKENFRGDIEITRQKVLERISANINFMRKNHIKK